MSIYTTLDITRTKALKLYLSANNIEITDKMLEDFMDKALEPYCYNCIIVSDDSPNNNNECPL